VKTDDLIALLAHGSARVDPRAGGRRLVVAVGGGTLAAIALSWSVLGLRPNLVEEASIPMFWAREAFCAALATAGLAAVYRLARPGMRLGRVAVAAAAPLLAMWALAVLALLGARPEQRADLILGHTAAVCPELIAMISAPALVAFLWLMKGLAPTRLRLAGAACGLAAGAIGALAYTLHCPELAAPFLAIWYVLGMLIPTGVGAWLGPRLLRW
jgi:hypothetical protein